MGLRKRQEYTSPLKRQKSLSAALSSEDAKPCAFTSAPLPDVLAALLFSEREADVDYSDAAALPRSCSKARIVAANCVLCRCLQWCSVTLDRKVLHEAYKAVLGIRFFLHLNLGLTICSVTLARPTIDW